MSKQHYGALGAVILGYLFCRIFAFQIVDLIGSVGGHHRSAGIAAGLLLAGIPFVILTLFTAVRLSAPHVLHNRVTKAVFLVGWVVAGGAMGMLPYSRVGTSIHLLHKEATTAPGFLHGLDVGILIGLFVTVGMLFLALARRSDHDRSPGDWIEHQFEDER